MKNTFKKGQHYKFKGIKTMDSSVPSKGAVIEVYPKSKKIDYLMVSGTEPTSGIREFTKDSEMAEALTLIE